MPTDPMENLSAGELQITAERLSAGSVRLLLTGKSIMREPGKVMVPYLNRVLEAVGPGGRVALHFEGLDHFNSSTIAVLVQFINTAQPKGVTVEMHYDPGLRWQALSFDALKRVVTAFASTGVPVQFVQTARK